MCPVPRKLRGELLLPGAGRSQGRDFTAGFRRESIDRIGRIQLKEEVGGRER